MSESGSGCFPCDDALLTDVNALRYPWRAKAGDYVNENPGTIHTLWMGEDAEVLFNVTGSIEFFNSDGELREIMDLFSFWRMYVEHCQEKGVQPNEKLWY